jgi:hypothetical protein
MDGTVNPVVGDHDGIPADVPVLLDVGEGLGRSG